MFMIRKIIKSDEGVVGVIVAILLIGLMLTVIGIIQSVYVPQWLEQKEADHMHIVSYQFTQLKHSLDILSVIEEKNEISVYLTLGIADVPIIGSGRTYDTLEVLSDQCSIEISNQTYTISSTLDIIKYSSGNTYFVDQSFIFEAGSLILSQSNANIINGQPFLSISNNTNLSFNIINISGVDGKRYAGGYGTYPVYIEFLESNSYTIEDFERINIITNYKNAWRLFFNSSSLRYSGLTYEINDNVDGISVVFSDTLGDIDLKVIDIKAQIAPGWIE